MADTKENCLQYVPLLDAYRDSELADEERVAVQAHLDSCDQCCKRLEAINRLVAVLKEVSPIVAPRDYADEIEARLANRKSEKSSEKVVSIGSAGKRPIIWVASIAASLLLTFGLAQLISSNHSGSLQLTQSPTQSKNVAKKIALAPPEAGVLTAQSGLPQLHNAFLPSAITNGATPVKVSPQSVADKGTARQQSQVADDSAAIAQTATLKMLPAKEDRLAVHISPQGQIASKKGNREITGDNVTSSTPGDVDAAGHSLVAYYDQEQATIPEALGISTDEDGLYAIKM
jgi:anti-sigma factor RsiW